MKYNFNGKEINIPDEEIKNNMKILEISEEEAIQMYLEDEGYLENEEVQELTKKAKENKTTLIKARENVENKKTERKPKENPLKQCLISQIYNFLREYSTISDLKIENPTKIITFKCDNKEFKLDLVEKRAKKTK